MKPFEVSNSKDNQTAVPSRKRLHGPISANPNYHLLSNRTRNRFDEAGIRSLADLTHWDEYSLLQLRGFGGGCVEEVKAFLQANNLQAVSILEQNSTYSAHSLSGYRRISKKARTILGEAGFYGEQDLSETTVQEVLKIPGMDTGIIDELVFEGVMPRPRDYQSFLLLLSASETMRRGLDGFGGLRGSGVHYVDELTQCRAKVDEQIEAGVLLDNAVMDHASVQSINQSMRPPARGLTDLLFTFQYALDYKAITFVRELREALDATSLKDELQVLFDRLNRRDLEILRERFGVGKRPTLSELGGRFEVSRERIRQIENQVSERLREDYYWHFLLPRLRTAMLLVRQHTVVSLSGILELLHERELADSKSTIIDFLSVWRAISPDAAAVREILALWRCPAPEDYAFPEGIDSFAKTGLNSRQQAASPAVLKAAMPLVRQVGAVTVTQVVEELAEYDISAADVAAILAADGMQEILPGYLSRPVGKQVPLAVARKMLAVCGALNLQELRRGLVRHQRRQGYPVAPAAVLRAVLKQDEGLYIGSDDVVVLQDSNAQETLSTWERVWLNLVGEKGPVVHTDSVHQAFAENGLRPVTAYVLLRKSSLVEQVEPQLFCLPGAHVIDEDMVRGESQALKIDPDPTFTYDEVGDVVFETTAQQYMDRGGSLSSGPARVMEGNWKTVVDGEEIGEFSVGSPWIYGLSEARDALDLRAGDRIGIRFNTWTRQGHVYVVGRGHDR